MTRHGLESAPGGLVPPEQQIDRLNRVAAVHPGPPHPPQADVVAGRMQATWPFFGACRLTGSEERSAAPEHARVFSPRSLSIFRPCRSSRQGAVLLGHAGVSLHGNAKHIRGRPSCEAPPLPRPCALTGVLCPACFWGTRHDPPNDAKHVQGRANHKASVRDLKHRSHEKTTTLKHPIFRQATREE